MTLCACSKSRNRKGHVHEKQGISEAGCDGGGNQTHIYGAKSHTLNHFPLGAQSCIGIDFNRNGAVRFFRDQFCKSCGTKMPRACFWSQSDPASELGWSRSRSGRRPKWKRCSHRRSVQKSMTKQRIAAIFFFHWFSSFLFVSFYFISGRNRTLPAPAEICSNALLPAESGKRCVITFVKSTLPLSTNSVRACQLLQILRPKMPPDCCTGVMHGFHDVKADSISWMSQQHDFAFLAQVVCHGIAINRAGARNLHNNIYAAALEQYCFTTSPMSCFIELTATAPKFRASSAL